MRGHRIGGGQGQQGGSPVPRLLAAAVLKAYGQLPQRRVWLADPFEARPPKDHLRGTGIRYISPMRLPPPPCVPPHPDQGNRPAVAAF